MAERDRYLRVEQLERREMLSVAPLALPGLGLWSRGVDDYGNTMSQAAVISLEGPLGAGKTHFVKAVAVALEIAEDVTSPTFTLLQSYGSGESRMHHSDWYRLESEAEVLALALDEYYGEGVMFIEWGDKFPAILPPRTIRIRIEPQSDESRLITWRTTTP